MKKDFIKYNKIVIITFIISYLLIVLFVDLFHYKSWIVVLCVSAVQNIVNLFGIERK